MEAEAKALFLWSFVGTVRMRLLGENERSLWHALGDEGKRSFLNETEQYLLETQIAIGNSREANNAVS